MAIAYNWRNVKTAIPYQDTVAYLHLPDVYGMSAPPLHIPLHHVKTSAALLFSVIDTP